MNALIADRQSLPHPRRSTTASHRTATSIASVCLGVFLSAVGIAGCTWVPVSAEASLVEVARSESAVSGCKQVGVINAKTQSQVGIIPRNNDRISEELEGLAKNEAVELGANTILASGPPEANGSQKFRAYHCPRS